MAEGCCGKCSKFMLFVFNLIFWLAGIGLLAFGIWLRLDNDIAKIVSLDLPWFYNATYVMMGVGGFTMIMGFLGCCGAMKENKCMLTMYTICLGLVFIAEIAGGVVAFVYRNNLNTWVDEAFSGVLDGQQIESLTQDTRDAIITLQTQFTCCGLTNPNNWADPSAQPSCPCPAADQGTNKCEVVGGTEYRLSCVDELKLYLEQNIVIVGAVALAVAAVEIFGIIFACVLLRQADKETSGIA
ncbi:tetraspanin-2-like [Branchiostoma floridae x Branchiostoma belcheri]